MLFTQLLNLGYDETVEEGSPCGGEESIVRNKAGREFTVVGCWLSASRRPDGRRLGTEDCRLLKRLTASLRTGLPCQTKPTNGRSESPKCGCRNEAKLGRYGISGEGTAGGDRRLNGIGRARQTKPMCDWLERDKCNVSGELQQKRRLRTNKANAARKQAAGTARPAK